MDPRPTLQAILQGAIQREIESQKLYVHLGRYVKDDAAREAFDRLALQEEGHQMVLEEYLRGEIREGALCSSFPVNYKIAEKLDQPQVSPGMELKDVFMLAAHREKLSHELYEGLAGIFPNGKVKRVFADLAAQELLHKQTVETLFTQVAFPQTDGG